MVKTTMTDVSHCGPSFCVKFLEENRVFEACGPFLQIFNYKTKELIHRVRIFKKNKIHGFSASRDSTSLVIFGGKSVCIVKKESLLSSNDVSDLETLASEWIVAAEFCFTDDKVYLLTCYNLVIIVDLEGSILERKGLVNERSILYSGSIKVMADKVYINAGTVMGGVLIWDLYSESKIYNLTGHEGSIFYVTVSDNGKLIASCSDDRSIRLWSMETGEELTVGWGHTARIWNLKFFDNDTKLISVSEDCTCRTWDICSTTDNGSYELQATNVFEVHLIKNVWGVDVNEEDMIAATTGNDGRLKLIDLKQSSRYGDEIETFNVTEIGQEFDIDFKKDEIIKGFAWFTFGLVAITSMGKIIKYNVFHKSWELTLVDDRLVSYSATNSLRDENGNNIIVFSNNKADLLLLSLSSDGKTIVAKNTLHIEGLSKTTNCMVVPSGTDRNSFLLTFESPNPRDKFKIIRFNLQTLEIIDEYNFTKPNNFVSSCLEVYDNFVLVGSRFSTIAIFDLNKSADEGYEATLIKRVNQGDTMTSIKYVETKGNKHLFSVTNRDGYYNFISLTFSDSDIKYEIVHSNKVIKGFLEGAHFNVNNEYVTYGFKSSLFYMYNEKNGYEIVSQVCGGAHRQWKLSPLTDAHDDSFMLVYVKSSQLYFRRIYKPMVPETLVNGLHGREIRDLSICPKARINGDHLFVTGSEDTSIKLNSVNINTGAIETYWGERKHVSGLQKLEFINDKLMISCSAREELFLWEVCDEFDSNPYINVKQTLPVSSDNPDLRIMDFDIKFINETDFILHTVYSDSAIKIWYYEMETNTFRILLSTKYKTCCIFNTAMVDFHDSTYLVLAPTDGYLSIYNVSDIIKSPKDEKTTVEEESEPEISVRVHKSGIKCIDNYISADGKWKIYTGGDDNGIGTSVFEIDIDTGKLIHTAHSLVEDVASSTVTSCQVFENGSKLLTTSVDQIVRVWDISKDDNLRLTCDKYTTIADTGCCDILPVYPGKDIALIGGVGISMWTLE